MSVTTLVARPLEAMVDEEEHYEAARRQADQLMAEAPAHDAPAGRATSSTTVTKPLTFGGTLEVMDPMAA